MIKAQIQIIKKSEVEQFPCTGLELVKAIIVKNSTEAGRSTVILRLTDGTNFYEYETTGRIFKSIASIVPTE